MAEGTIQRIYCTRSAIWEWLEKSPRREHCVSVGRIGIFYDIKPSNIMRRKGDGDAGGMRRTGNLI